MEKFAQLDGLVVPLDRANVDTDAIIPKQFLKSIKRSGFGPNAFDEWRYLDHGEPGMDNSRRPLNPDFVLNQPRYQGAQILLARRLDADKVDELFKAVEAAPGYRLQIDLEQQSITAPDGTKYKFEVEAFRKHCLLNGLDDIGLTLQHVDEIAAFEAKHRAAQPWL